MDFSLQFMIIITLLSYKGLFEENDVIINNKKSSRTGRRHVDNIKRFAKKVTANVIRLHFISILGHSKKRRSKYFPVNYLQFNEFDWKYSTFFNK